MWQRSVTGLIQGPTPGTSRRVATLGIRSKEESLDRMMGGPVGYAEDNRTFHQHFSLTALTQKLLDTDRTLQPSPYWTYQGKRLIDIRDENYDTL
jgi:hypothetical protein